MAIEIGVFQNGASDLSAKTTDSGVVVTDGDLEATHLPVQRIIKSHVRQCVLADRLGFDYWFQTEHHFQPEGAELSPQPLLSEDVRRGVRRWMTR